jgi:hypothetical protein
MIEIDRLAGAQTSIDIYRLAGAQTYRPAGLLAGAQTGAPGVAGLDGKTSRHPFIFDYIDLQNACRCATDTID